jgi:2,4-dienoyl-CoA reductase-like NADH-dependent reductase (Old Yellow Enzyme family)
MNSVLFETAKIKNIELRNRFVMSAAADHLSTEEGHVTNLQIARFNQLAEGGVGLIISGAILAHSSGKTYAARRTTTTLTHRILCFYRGSITLQQTKK